MRARLLAASTAGLLALAAALPAWPQGTTHTVKIEGVKFPLASINVRRGDRIVWQNLDVVPHTATAVGRFDSGSIAAGKSWTQAAPAPGRYDVVCTFHPGMKTTLVVQ
jgi:plastocyanin